jgi:hypothetical protein
LFKANYYKAFGGEVAIGPMQFNLIFDAAAEAAPQSFRNAIQAAANILAADFTDNVTINIAVDYSGTGGGANGGPSSGNLEPYSVLVGQLAAQASADVLSGVNALPSGSSIQGQTEVAVWNAEEKALGLLSPTNSSVDGSVSFATDIPTSDLVAVALHEIAHAMGRVPNGPQPDVFDLFRYTGAGALLFSDANPSASAYFSLDGGHTDVADYGISSDPSDFLNGGVGPPNDAFDEFYTGNTLGFLTRTDILQMEALGFHALAHPVGDYLGQGASDILWRNANGDLVLWDSTVGVGANTGGQDFGSVGTQWQVQQLADVNGDGKEDVVWRDPTTGEVMLWNSVAGAGSVGFTSQDVGVVPLSWHLEASGDFSGSGPDALLWRNDNGDVTLWTASPSGAAVGFVAQDLGVVPTSYQIAGVGDFNDDGKTDILWRNTNGDLVLWDSVPGAGSVNYPPGLDLGVVSTAWQIQGVGDFNGDGKADILWRNANGELGLWNSIPGAGSVGFTYQNWGVVPTSWHIQEVGDFNGDGKADILWRNDDGDVVVWSATGLSGTSVVFSSHDFGVVTSDWQIQSDWHGT